MWGWITYSPCWVCHTRTLFLVRLGMVEYLNDVFAHLWSREESSSRNSPPQYNNEETCGFTRRNINVDLLDNDDTNIKDGEVSEYGSDNDYGLNYFFLKNHTMGQKVGHNDEQSN